MVTENTQRHTSPDPRHLTVLRLAALGIALLGLVPVANLLSGGREVVWWRGAMLVWSAYGGLLVALLWIASSRWGTALDHIIDRTTRRVLGVPSAWFVAATATFTTAAAAFVAQYSYGGRAFTGDEMAMSWHARMLLAGHMAIPRPAHSEFFSIFGVMDTGPRWFSQFPILGPALHAVGLAAGALPLVNPVLLGFSAWQLHRFVRRSHGEATARAATLLFALSPFILVLGATQLSHTPALLLTLFALAQLAAWEQSTAGAQHRAAIWLGLAVGGIALVRPFDAFLVAVPIGIYQLFALRRDPSRMASIATQCVAGLLPALVLAWANVHTTGRPFLLAYDAAHGPAHGIGFHVDPMGGLHTPLRGLIYTSGYLLRFNRFLFEWPLPGLGVACLALITRRFATRWDSLLVALFASFLAGYFAYWYPGFFDGPRFLFPVAPVLIIAVVQLPEGAMRFTGTRRRVLQLLVPACVLCAWLVPLPFTSVPARLAALREQRAKLKLNVPRAVERAGLTNALVFIPESWHERLAARLRAIGVPFFDAERFVNTLDGCVLQTQLDAADVAASTDTAAMRNEILRRAAAAGRTVVMPNRLPETRIARAPGGLDTPRCQAEAALDDAQLMPYASFLRDQRVDRAGHLGGAVVFARDFGPRDTLLRAEFGARQWYRYRPGASANDAGVFEPMPRTP